MFPGKPKKVTQANLLSELATLVDKKRLCQYSIVSYKKRIKDSENRILQIEDNLLELQEQKRNLKHARIISLIEYCNIGTLIDVTVEELKSATAELADKRRILRAETATLNDVESRIKFITYEAAQYGRVIEFTNDHRRSAK